MTIHISKKVMYLIVFSFVFYIDVEGKSFGFLNFNGTSYSWFKTNKIWFKLKTHSAEALKQMIKEKYSISWNIYPHRLYTKRL